MIGDDVFSALVWSATCFVAGVTYSAYRAVGWVDRIRSWAETCPVEQEEVSP